MKLLQYTNYKLTVLLLLLISAWGTLFYFAIHHEIMDETDDMLRSYRDIFIKKALHDPTLLQTRYESTFDRYAIRPVTDEEAEIYEETWLDMEVYFPEGDEHIPVRILKSVFMANDDQFYELEISMSTLERNDMIETLFRFLIALYILLLLCIIVGNSIILKTTFRPLQKLLNWINSIVPGKKILPLNSQTSVYEFDRLNQAVMNMTKRNLEAHEQQKQLIENTSHELQTPLAVALNKIELLMQTEELTEQQMGEIDEIYKTLNRAARLNRSMLLLSRIENNQFENKQEINLNTLVQKISADFIEIYSAKEFRFSIEEKSTCTVLMDEMLAQTLLSNLIKNAFVHTQEQGSISVELDEKQVIIRNSGSKSLDANKIFNRFYYSDKKNEETSTGLGLAIVKSITDTHHIQLTYHFNQEHIFTLKFEKQEK